MKFLVDESVEYRIVKFLRSKNYDTVSVSEISPSIKDIEVLYRANNENRVLITNDKDFGELVFRRKQPNKGVILLRIANEDINFKTRKLLECIKKKGDELINNFTVVTDKKTRVIKIHEKRKTVVKRVD